MDYQEMQRVGDMLQSEASRLAEYVRSLAEGGGRVPYEVVMAMLEVESAVDSWTALRTSKNAC